MDEIREAMMRMSLPERFRPPWGLMPGHVMDRIAKQNPDLFEEESYPSKVHRHITLCDEKHLSIVWENPDGESTP